MPITKGTPPRGSRRTKPAILICSEKYACSLENAAATFWCDQCATYQCQACELHLHQLPRYQFHDRQKLPKPSSDELCEQGATRKCFPRNFADVVCIECGRRRYCFDCDAAVHRGRPMSSHSRVSVLQDCGTSASVLPETTDQSVKLLPSDMSEGILSADADDRSIYVSIPSYPSMTSEAAAHETISVNKSTEAVDEMSALDDVLAADNQEITGASVLSIDVERTCSAVSNHCSNDSTDSLDGSVVLPPCDLAAPDSFSLLSQHEEIMVHGEEEFVKKLQCDAHASVKVVCIAGKAGSGKSFTLNHTLFDGCEVFPTKPFDSSCGGCGVWSAYDAVHEAIVLDTEGWLDNSSRKNHHIRLLLKAIAISDILIVAAKSEHLHSDIFQFLAEASNTYRRHISPELVEFGRTLSVREDTLQQFSRGPAVILFHETQYAEPLAKGAAEPAKKMLLSRFDDQRLSCDGFSSLEYVGTRTSQPPTDYKPLLLAVKRQLHSCKFRVARTPATILLMLKFVNERFADNIENVATSLNHSSERCLMCNVHCLVCNSGCVLSRNHDVANFAHEAATSSTCCYDKKFGNQIFLCRNCYERGEEVVVNPKVSSSIAGSSAWMSMASYAWSGYVLECDQCGVIFRSYEHWFGNVDPHQSSLVVTKVQHVWPGTNRPAEVTLSAGRRIVDSLTQVADVAVATGAGPTKLVADWMMDHIAPSYWVPNAVLTNCHGCGVEFGTEVIVHHCRACGNGFCDSCSSKRRPVPERNWGTDAVRVCDACYDVPPEHPADCVEDGRSALRDPVARRIGEAVGLTVGMLTSVVSYPVAALNNVTRPDYWKPDDAVTECCVCAELFTTGRRLHHCRACGQGVCDCCSPTVRPVPSRGWEYPVRVCNKCIK